MVVNIAIVVHRASIESYHSLLDYKDQRAKNLRDQQKLKNQKLIYDANPDMFPEIGLNIEEIEAIQDCKSWLGQRKWLKLNNVEFSQYPEEVKFQEHIKKFDIQNRAQYVEIVAAQNYATEKLLEE